MYTRDCKELSLYGFITVTCLFFSVFSFILGITLCAVRCIRRRRGRYTSLY